MTFARGDFVRLINDPGRAGSIAGEPLIRAGKTKYRVRFSDGPSTHKETELELVPIGDDDPYDLLAKGQFGRVGDLRRNLTHIQLSGKLANLVYSMDTTNTDFYAYQYKPLVSFMDSPAKGILIADEVGLGKTIEAGLIWTELRARYDARRLMVICPSMLREKWKDELRKRFGIQAHILKANELLSELKRTRYEVPDGSAIICSIDGIKPPKGWDKTDAAQTPRQKLATLFDDQEGREPLFDLVIIDEAHYMRNPSSQNAKLGQMLRDVTENILLLSATPVNLKSADLFHLLNLVDADTFNRPEAFPLVLEANGPLLEAREAVLNLDNSWGDVRSYLNDAQQHFLLASNRQLQSIINEGDAEGLTEDRRARVKLANRIERVNLLRNVVSRTRKIDVTELKVVREPKTHYVQLDPMEAAFYKSVTNGVRRFAIKRDINEGFLLAQPQRQVSSCMYAAAKSWSKGLKFDKELAYEDLGVDKDVEEDSVSPLIDQLREDAMPGLSMKALREVDSKYRALKQLLQQYYQDAPDEKVVLFSYYRETLRYLAERLEEDGILGEVLMGGIRETKQEVIDRFRDDPNIHIVLCSEVASEGVDLQFCRVLINYDLPWNPMKIEQRIGRIDRIGQKSPKINIINLCYKDTIDQRIHDRLFERLNIFRQALGGLETILGEKISELTRDLLTYELTPEQEATRIEKTALAVENIRREEESLEGQASNLIAHSGFILEQVQAAHEFKKRITEADLVVYVSDYLEKFGQGHQLQQVGDIGWEFDLQLPGSTAAAFDVFLTRHNLRGQSSLSSGDKKCCIFENKVVAANPKKEVISQFHPFIRFISQDLNERNEGFCPLVALEVAVSDVCDVSPGSYAFSLKRWSFEGLRVEEELRASVISLTDASPVDADYSWDFLNACRVAGRDWLAVKNSIDTDRLEDKIEHCTDTIDESFDKATVQRVIENQDRVDFQVQSAERYRDRQLSTQRELVERYQRQNKSNGVQLAKGKIQAIQQRFDTQVEQLKLKSELRFSAADVCVGVILVTE